MNTEFLRIKLNFPSERCYIVELFRRKEGRACSIARLRVKRSVTKQRQSLRGLTKRCEIFEGQGTVVVGHVPANQLGACGVVQIPPGFSIYSGNSFSNSAMNQESAMSNPL